MVKKNFRCLLDPRGVVGVAGVREEEKCNQHLNEN